MTPMHRNQMNMMTLNSNNSNHSSNTPRYGPLPSLAAMQAMTHTGSAPLHRRLRTSGALPPPAYSDLDEFECESESGEPRYQPMPLHSLISRRPLPSQPTSTNSRRGSGGSKNGTGQLATNTTTTSNVPMIAPTTNSSASPSTSEEEEGDYEDISQL